VARAGDYKGKEADRLVTRIDPGVVSLVSELRGHERQATGELERWETGVEEPKPLDASPAAITLAMLMTDEELDSLETSGPLEMEKSRGADDRVEQVSQALQPAAGHGQPALAFPANAAAADGRPWLEGVMGY
jgi:hypothetical protein